MAEVMFFAELQWNVPHPRNVEYKYCKVISSEDWKFFFHYHSFEDESMSSFPHFWKARFPSYLKMLLNTKQMEVKNECT